jgi:nitrogen fixation protein
MPNWVENKLTVRGEKNLLSLFEARVGQTYTFEKVKTYDHNLKDYVNKDITISEPLSFWNIIQPPKNKWELYHASANGTEDKTWNWYSWNNANWGTKWDASNVEVESKPTEVVYSFSTPWAPPVPVLVAASIQYPDLYLELRYVEEQGWGGNIILKNGQVLNEKSWDIPETHKAMLEAGLECWCDGTDDEKPFEDCPKP